MKLLWSAAAWNDYLYWQETDPDIARRINVLLRFIGRNPFKGICKPEPLRGDLSGWWSKRITGDHRIVYCIRRIGDDQQIEVVACRYHYSGRR